MEKAYETYKDSGVVWIGKIPNHWYPIRLKYIGYLYSGLSGKKGNDFRREHSEFNQKYIPFTNIANNFQIDSEKLDTVEIFENEDQNSVKKNDLFFLMSSENYDDIGKTSVLKNDLNNTYLNSFCKGFRLFNKENVDAGFLNYLLSGDIYRKILSIEAKGFTRINLQMGKIENLPVIIPALKQEQSQIAAYLDYHTGKIDQLISKKESLIQKIQEQHQAIINEAVIKGLNPEVELKDSGNDWLGKIPKHWEVVKLKFIIDELESGVSVNSEGEIVEPKGTNYGILKTSAVFAYDFNPFENKKVVENEINRLRCPVKKDSIIISRMNTPDLVGSLGYVSDDYNNLFLPDRLWQTVIEDKSKIDVEFLCYILKSDQYRKLVSSKASGTSPSMKNITKSDFLESPVPLIPINEQLEIKKFLNFNDNKIDAILEGVKTSIQKLKAYRQSLISEAVTGKIDVRGWEKPSN